MDYWLPEFEPSPEISDEELHFHFPFPVKKQRGRWMGKTMAVKQDNSQEDFQLHMQMIRSVAPTIPRCQCHVCRLVNSSTLQSPKHLQHLMNLELVAHGREKFTVYDRSRPWQRVHVNNCTNPRPLERRMPPLSTGGSEAVNCVYRKKMLLPGRVIRDPKKRSIN